MARVALKHRQWRYADDGPMQREKPDIKTDRSDTAEQINFPE
jgi:hypothetical protein